MSEKRANQEAESVDREVRANLAARVLVRPVGEGEELERLAGHEVLDHVAAAVAELAGIVHVRRVGVAQLRRPQVDIHRRDARVDEDILDPRLGHANARLGVPEVQEAAR